MGMIFMWIIFSFVAGSIGSKRKIGFWPAFLLSLLLTPLIGLIVALASRRKDDIQYQNDLLNAVSRNSRSQEFHYDTESMAASLERIKRLKEEGHLTESEYEVCKAKILSSTL